MATIKEIAEHAGVSVGTVDRVIHNRGRVNEQTRKRILEMIRTLNYTPNRVAQGLAVRKKKLRFGFFYMDSAEHPFFADVNAAAKQAAKELTDYGVEVDFFRVEVYIAKDGTSRSCVRLPKGVCLHDYDGFVTPGASKFDGMEALPQSIPVVYYNNNLEDTNYLAYVGCNYREAGRIAAGLCALSADEKRQIAIFNEGAPIEMLPAYGERLQGLKECLERDYPGYSIQGYYFFKNEYEAAYEGAMDFFKKHPDVSVVYVINPGNYDICHAVRQVDPKRKVRIITNDLGERSKQLMQAGIISACITQEPEDQGAEPLQILFDYLVYNKKPQNKMKYTKLAIHIAGNTD